MKIKIGLISVLIIIGIRANSQEYSFGLKSGFNMDNIKTTGYKDQYNTFIMRTSFNFQMIYNYSFNKKIQIQFEPGYIGKGGKARIKYPNNYEAEKFGYITLPSVFIYKPLEKLSIEIGPEFALLIYHHDNFFLASNYRRVEISGLVGVSYNIIKRINLGMRYGLGFTPMYDGRYEAEWNVQTTGNINYQPCKLYNRYFELFTRVFILNYQKDKNIPIIRKDQNNDQHSQQKQEQRISFGLKSGYNISYLSATADNFSSRPKSSYHFALINNYSFNKHFQFQIEPGFIEKGAKVKTEIPYVYTYEYLPQKYGFFTLPFIFIYKPINRLSLEIGPDLSFLIYIRGRDKDGNIYNIEDYNYNNLEISGLAGISYNIYQNFSLGVRYGTGITPIYREYIFSQRTGTIFDRFFEFSLRVNLVKFKK